MICIAPRTIEFQGDLPSMSCPYVFKSNDRRIFLFRTFCNGFVRICIPHNNCISFFQAFISESFIKFLFGKTFLNIVLIIFLTNILIYIRVKRRDILLKVLKYLFWLVISYLFSIIIYRNEGNGIYSII